jgi:hypothetical protein
MPKKFFIAFIVLISFSGCGPAPCANGPITPFFIGFSPGDIDTLVVRQFKPDDNFQHLTDSTLFINHVNILYTTSNDTAIVNFNHISGEEKYILPGSDWQIYIPSINKTISISNIISPQSESSCFKCGCLNVIKSFEQDGQSTIPQLGAVPYFGENYLMYIKK